jgi:hypothetical protein
MTVARLIHPAQARDEPTYQPLARSLSSLLQPAASPDAPTTHTHRPNAPPAQMQRQPAPHRPKAPPAPIQCQPAPLPMRFPSHRRLLRLPSPPTSLPSESPPLMLPCRRPRRVAVAASTTTLAPTRANSQIRSTPSSLQGQFMQVELRSLNAKVIEFESFLRVHLNASLSSQMSASCNLILVGVSESAGQGECQAWCL